MKQIIKYSVFALAISLVIAACTNAEDYNLETEITGITLFYETLDDGTLGGFINQQVVGEYPWFADSYGYANITGYVGGVDHDNEAWLISPWIDLTLVDAAHFSFDHVVRYFANPLDEATLWISENYEDGLPETADWTQLEPQIPFSDPGNWDLSNSGDISLTEFAGKRVRIAFKYISTVSKAGTWEVKNFVVSSGEAVEIDFELGKGSSTQPYNVLGATMNQGQNGKWVKGKIIGYIIYGNPTKYIFDSGDNAEITNLILADSDGMSYISQILAVQLPAGAVRNGLNLRDNPELLGQEVTMYGNLASYFNMSGLKDVAYFELEDGTSAGTLPFNPEDAIFAETLLNRASYDKFSAYSVKGAQEWTFDGQFGAKMSGFADNRSYVNEDWFISPALDLSEYESVKLSFEHARGPAGSINVGVSEGYYTVWVSNNYVEGDPNEADWEELTGVVHGTTAWGYVSSGLLNFPKAKLSENTHFAFKYLCNDQESATWEIKNVMLQ